MDYLLKTELAVYSFADLVREGETIWDGVTNPAAVKHLRAMKPGDRLILYHTGGEKTARGTAAVVSVDASNLRAPLVRIRVGEPLTEPRTLRAIKANELFARSPLVT